MGVRQKVFMGFGAILFFILLFAIIGYWGNARAADQLTEIIDRDYQLVDLTSEMEANVSSRVILARGYVLYGDERYKEQFLKETEEATVLKEQIKAITGETDAYNDAVAKSIQWENLIIDQVIPAYEAGGFDAAIPIMEEFCQVWSTEANDAWKTIQDGANEELLQTSDSILAENQAQQHLFIIMAILTAIVALAVAAWMTYFIVKPIKAVTARLQQIAKNDFSGDALFFKRKDEFQLLANSLNEMVGNLRDMFARIKGAEGNLLATSSMLVASRDSLGEQAMGVQLAVERVSSGSVMQMESANETATAMETVSSGIDSIATSSAAVVDYSMKVTNYAEEGNRIIQDTIGELTGMSNTVNGTVNAMESLGNRTSRISEISALIKDIAEQTNLLALNATIEAARAGEYGKGFAVVAKEIRKLAERSKDSSKEIGDLITAIGEDTSVAVSSTRKSKEEMESSLHAANNAGLAFKNILAAVENISAQIQEVSTSSEEMSASTEQITAALEQLAGIARENVNYVDSVTLSTQQQMASMQEVGASVEELNGMSRELNGILAGVRV